MPDLVKRIVVANDMLEIIRLPEVLVESRPAIAFDPSNVSVGRDRFEALKYAATDMAAVPRGREPFAGA